jgi:hypothetical protein
MGLIVRFPEEARDFFLFQMVRTRNGTHPASYSMGTRNSFPTVKRSVCKAGHLPPGTEVNNEWSYTSSPPLPYVIRTYTRATLSRIDSRDRLNTIWLQCNTRRSNFGQPCYGHYMQDSICNCSNCSGVWVEGRRRGVTPVYSIHTQQFT